MSQKAPTKSPPRTLSYIVRQLAYTPTYPPWAIYETYIPKYPCHQGTDCRLFGFDSPVGMGMGAVDVGYPPKQAFPQSVPNIFHLLSVGILFNACKHGLKTSSN